MAQLSHVPKFGNWDGDNVPYTAYFENARKEKISGVRMNPNDPEENPEAFMFAGLKNGNDGHRRNTPNPQKSMDQKRNTSESSSDKSNYDSSHQRKRSELKKSMTENSNGFIPLSPTRNRARGASNASDDISYKSASVPKFGAWDERDPKSGEGFTVIFNRVKEEKQIAASKLPPVHPQSSNYSESQKRAARSKMFCCLF